MSNRKMMNYLAHGTLGNFDELIFGGVVVIFMVMMGLSWFRSLNQEPDEETLADQPEDISTDPEHFRLD